MESKKNPFNLTEIKSEPCILWSIASGVWIIVSKTKLYWCHACCSPIHGPFLVSSRNALSVAWRDQTTANYKVNITCWSFQPLPKNQSYGKNKMVDQMCWVIKTSPSKTNAQVMISCWAFKWRRVRCKWRTQNTKHVSTFKGAFFWEDPDLDLWFKITEIMVHERNGVLGPVYMEVGDPR